jgi:serine/threonine-protein kinase
MLQFDPQGVRPLPFDESPGFTPPAAFGPYRVLHQIGSGVLGPVFRTYDPQQDRLVAVKAFRLDVVPEVVAKLADALRRLPSNAVSHPAIVPVLDAGLEGMSAYLAMEYVTAETLDVALRHLAPAPLDRVLPILTELAGAIDAAWAAGVGHGSLHPRDVFVGSGTNEVRVTGFGVAPALEAVGIRIPPRRPYAAPERGTSEAWDVRADIYSLGVLAHELLTKRRPGGANEQDGSLVTGTSPEARALIRKVLAAALADRPEHRFASAGAFANALTAIVKGEPLGTLPEGASVSEEKPAPKKHEPPPLLAISEAPEPAPPAPQAVVEEPVSTVAPEPVRRPPVTPPAPVRPPVPVVEPSAPVPVRDRAAPPVRPSPPPMRVSPAPLIVPTRTPFPWVAVLAASIASATLFGVGGYRLGLSRRPAPSATEAATPTAPPPGTDVVVAPPPSIGPPAVTSTKLPEPGSATPNAGSAKPAATGVTPPARPAPAKPPQTTRARGDVTTGSMVVETRPAGARVIIDGKPAGVTPVTLSDLRAGSHPLRIELIGYKTLVTSVIVKAGERSRVAVTLELAGVPGSWMPFSR